MSVATTRTKISNFYAKITKWRLSKKTQQDFIIRKKISTAVILLFLHKN